MDYDNDGILDFLSGSYDPGDVYLFRGLGKGRYAKVQKLRDKDSVPIVHHPKQLIEYERIRVEGDQNSDDAIQNRVASFGSWVAPVDWENDGDLDLLIGSFRGRIYLRKNEGSRTSPVYSPESIAVQADGARLQVEDHANPVVADWNEDGRWDLVVGASDGSVVWYENTGTANAPRFEKRELLVQPKADGIFLTQHLEPGEEPAPGVRAQICVVDYDLDGRLDLVLGDYSNCKRLRALDDDERSEFDRILEAIEEMRGALREVDDESEEGKAITARLDAMRKQRDSFYVDPEEELLSHVWLYLRRPHAR